MKFITKLVLLVKCPVCQNKSPAIDTMLDTICKSCQEKKDNVGKYAGFSCNRGHPLIFQRYYFPDRYEPYCDICRCFCIPTKRDKGLRSFSTGGIIQ